MRGAQPTISILILARYPRKRWK